MFMVFKITIAACVVTVLSAIFLNRKNRRALACMDGETGTACCRILHSSRFAEFFLINTNEGENDD